MSDQSTAERKAAARRLAPGTSIDNLTFLLGVGAIVAALVGGSCSTNARIGDLHTQVQGVRAEIRDVRARVERLEDSTAVSFATVHRQLGAVAVCLLDLRNMVGDSGAAGRVPTACDDAIQAILTPSAPAGR